MRPFIVAAAVALTFASLTLASGASAAQVDYFNKTHPRVASSNLGGGAGRTRQSSGAGAGKITAHCAPGATGKACHRP